MIYFKRLQSICLKHRTSLFQLSWQSEWVAGSTLLHAVIQGSKLTKALPFSPCGIDIQPVEVGRKPKGFYMGVLKKPGIELCTWLSLISHWLKSSCMENSHCKEGWKIQSVCPREEEMSIKTLMTISATDKGRFKSQYCRLLSVNLDTLLNFSEPQFPLL